ncbi:MAG: phosphatidate cytidylyltransferase [Alphaproteobacteria bacterium]|nr:phosphatidate cytidylyltransferase [Alphaproteobacteria bacterium]MCD8520402.1 phosphatidate cytidylyltransferase [Alphaproteobacteria bacterium]MCD8570089.1 phosphatidate cytidylyltransferase [Alphaproteobacteria bacterium]
MHINFPPLSEALQKRILSGLVLAPPCLLAAWLGGIWLVLMILVFIGLALWEWWKMSWHLNSDAEKSIFMFGILYILLGGYAFYTLGHPAWNGAAFAVLGMVVCSDIGAYFAGKKWGGPKLCPSISPNKTWAGLGGALGGAAAAGVICWLIGLHIESFMFAVFGGLTIGAAGQAGDLLESWAKRLAGVKDAGHLIPGHGGVLDRIDSLLLACPVFVVLSGLS